ncbi:MAG: potassium-transporting ATPase subunit KdpA [Phycisphaerales bacterium]
MTLNGLFQLVVYIAVLVALVKPLGWYMARVYQGKACGLDRLLAPAERLIYRLCGIAPEESMGWKAYASSILAFSAVGLVAVYGLQRLQSVLPLNPAALASVSADSSFNTAISFVSNTNWQGYGGETTMSYLSQMLGLGVQNFVSAATGMAVLVALVRGLAARGTTAIGNFWVDLTRSTLYILLPLSAVLALVLVSQGVVQTFRGYQTVTLVQPLSVEQTGKEGAPSTSIDAQVLPLGPAASQIAIKQLGTNGGGFFNTNSAHPFENPTPLSNFLQVLAILLIPAALCWTFGEMVQDRRQGWAVLAAMLVIFVPLLAATYWLEASGTSVLAGPNMEGKEARFGIANSALWATATTAASNGSVNAMHDSFTPLGGLVPMWLMQIGEVVFGGVGSGLYGMLMFVIVAVFVAGLMVGRTPEYLGKKIEPFEMKMAAIAVLIPCALVLLGTAAAVLLPQGIAGTSNPGPHGFSQILYAFSSASNNNGSAFAGLSANTPFYNFALGVCMFLARFWLIVPVLAIAGSLAAKKPVPATSGTLPTHTPVFVAMLVCVVIIVGALTFVPALALGPVAEQLLLRPH